MNAVEREPIETRVFNSTASEASVKPKQRSYSKTNLKKKLLAPDTPGAEISSVETYPTLNFYHASSENTSRTRGVYNSCQKDKSYVTVSCYMVAHDYYAK